MGAVSRINPGGTSAGGTVGTTVGEVSALDLIYTTRYGAVPLLHWRGGHLSICQWSRILTIASLRGTTALQAPGHAGIVDLGFGAPAKPPDSAGGPGDGGPIVMISPLTEHSAVWTWRPEPGISAFARVPRKLAEDDEAASRFGSDIDTTAPGQARDGCLDRGRRLRDTGCPLHDGVASLCRNGWWRTPGSKPGQRAASLGVVETDRFRCRPG